MRPLLEKFPRLAARIAHEPLCELPTPVEACPGLAPAGARDPAAAIFVKRDDLSAPDYGGNKIRKLEFLLADARARGAAETLTYGYAGSNFAAATAFYASRLKFRAISLLSPQKPAAYIVPNLLLGRAAGAELHHVRDDWRLAIYSAGRVLRSRIGRGRWPARIPVGGSSPIGILGFVNAALELGEQVARGELPRPDRIYIALGSMGSAAGLLLGLRLLGWEATRLIAVRAIDERTTNAETLLRLARRTARLLARRAPGSLAGMDERARTILNAQPWFMFRERAHRDLERLGVEIRHEYYGGVYGETAASRRAIESARADAGLTLDPTYSGKAMAAMYDDLRSGAAGKQTILFWATYNSRPLEPLIDGQEAHELPAPFARYVGAAVATSKATNAGETVGRSALKTELV